MKKERLSESDKNFFTKSMIIGISTVGFISYTIIVIMATALATHKSFLISRMNLAKDQGYLSEVSELALEITDLYNRLYVNDIETDKVDTYMLNALVASYGDRYAVYMNSKDSEQTSLEFNSKLYGIGVLAHSVYIEDEERFEPYFSRVYEGSPADKAGIEIGDILVKVDDNYLLYKDGNFNDHIDKLRGEKGTDVKITIKRGDELLDFVITRGEVTINTVSYDNINDVGYIKITDFDSKTFENFKIAFEKLQNQGVYKFIFDMRDNEGGLKDSVIDVLDYLLPEGEIITELNHDGNIVSVSKSDSKYKEFKSVTLINRNTASAAELFTQSLLDYNKTETIGSNSFGKGTICSTYELSNGGSLMLSTGKYLTKSKTDLERVGIKPDYELELPEEKLEILYKLDIHDDDLVLKGIEILNSEK